MRVDPSAENNFAVRWAAEQGHLAVVERLLDDDRVDAAVAIRYARPEDRKRFECRERLTEICIALQDLELPAWVTHGRSCLFKFKLEFKLKLKLGDSK